MNILKLIGGSFGGSWIVYLVIAVAVFGAGSATGYKTRGIFDAPMISKAQTEQAKAEKLAADTKAVLATYHAQIEADRADANARALAQEAELRGTIDNLQSQLRVKEVARQNASHALLEALHNVPQIDRTAIGPGARNYYDSVREQQRAASTGATPP